METDYRTLCRINVVSCTREYWWHEDEWEDLFYHIPRFSSELDAFAMWICVAFVLLMMIIALQFENSAFGGELTQCTELFAWLLPFASCILTWKKFTMFLWMKTYILWDRCFLSYLSFKHIISVKIGAQIYFVKLFSIKSNPYFIWNTPRHTTNHRIVLMTESPVWL